MLLQSMASKSALVTQMELELQQIKAAHSQANRAHEGHIAQLIASINELQELCTKQVGTVLAQACCQDGNQWAPQHTTNNGQICALARPVLAAVTRPATAVALQCYCSDTRCSW